MGFKFLSITLLSAALLTISCAKNNDTETHDPFPTYDANSPLGKELSAAILKCANSECESNKTDFESIGLVAFARDGYVPKNSSYKMGRCTGFLYGSNDIVALNSHCITDAMWENRSSCGETLAIRFPETPGHPTEIRSCTEIIYRSNIKEASVFAINADYAFFRIKPVNRVVLPLATSPTDGKQLVSVRKVNPPPNSKTLDGYLDYARCQTLTGSLLNSKYYNQWAETGLAVKPENSYSPCSIIQGNSGSPVLNARNEVIGFAQSYATPEFLTILKSSAFKDAFNKSVKINVNLDLPNYLPDHFQYTQALCVRNPRDINAENTTCAQKIPASISDQEEATTGFDNAKNVDEYIQMLKNSSAFQSSLFILDIVKDKDYHRYSVVPKCITNPKKWNQGELSSGSTVSGANKNVRSVKRALFIEPQVDVKFDSNLVQTSKRLTHTTTEGHFVFTIIGNQVGSVSRAKPSNFYFYEESLEQMDTAPWCP
tara:strand:+ start:51683 stop:53140 length:1458 start_codon:yes stop_codon:yes gene_type:complete